MAMHFVHARRLNISLERMFAMVDIVTGLANIIAKYDLLLCGLVYLLPKLRSMYLSPI